MRQTWSREITEYVQLQEGRTKFFCPNGNGNAALKKFFVRADWRGKRAGLVLYQSVIQNLKEHGCRQTLLDFRGSKRRICPLLTAIRIGTPVCIC